MLESDASCISEQSKGTFENTSKNMLHSECQGHKIKSAVSSFEFSGMTANFPSCSQNAAN